MTGSVSPLVSVVSFTLPSSSNIRSCSVHWGGDDHGGTDGVVGGVDCCRAGGESARGPQDRRLLPRAHRLDHPRYRAQALQPLRAHRDGVGVGMLGDRRRGIHLGRSGPAHPPSADQGRVRGRRDRLPAGADRMPDPRQPLRHHRRLRRERGRRRGPPLVPGPTRDTDLGHPAARGTAGGSSTTEVRETIPHRHLQSRR